MATQLIDAKLLVAGYDMTSDHNAVALEYGCEAVDDTAFGDAVRSNAGGLKTLALQAEGFWDSDGIDEPDDVYFSRIGASDIPVSVSGEGGDDGDRAFTFQANLAQYVPRMEVGAMLAFTVQASASGGTPVVRGTVMHNASRTSSGNGTARQLGAVVAGQRVYAALHVLSVSGTLPTLDVIIQSDDAGGMGSPTSRITFAQATALTAEFKSAAGAITDDYWRVNYTIGGSGSPTFSFVVVIGIA